MRIALLNAHTSYATGASHTYNGKLYTEYRLSSQINFELQRQLQSINFDVYIVDGSNEKPYSASLRYKASCVNDGNTNLAIETHFNSAFSAATAKYSSGLEVLYNSNKEANIIFATKMVESFRKYLPFKIRREGVGIHARNNLYILKNINCPVVITEICFLSHPVDRLFLLHPHACRAIANATLDGILRYRGTTLSSSSSG